MINDLTRLITFFLLVLLHIVRKIGMYRLLYILLQELSYFQCALPYSFNFSSENDSMRDRKNKCHTFGHGQLARYSPKIARAGQKSHEIHISWANGHRKLVDPSTARHDASKLSHATTGNAPKMIFFFLYLGTLYGKILKFSVFKKPLHVLNLLKTTPLLTCMIVSYHIGSP